MAEQVDAGDLKSPDLGRVGSIPSIPTMVLTGGKPKAGDLVYVFTGCEQITKTPALYIATETPEVNNEWNGQATHKVFHEGEYHFFATYFYQVAVLKKLDFGEFKS